MKNWLLTLLFFIGVQSTYAQVWFKQFGELEEEKVGSFFESSDKSIMCTPYYFHSGEYTDQYLMNLDCNGNVRWKFYLQDSIAVYSAKQTLDDGYILGGVISGDGSKFQADKTGSSFLLKLNSCMEVDWYTVFRFPFPYGSWVSHITVQPDTTYYVVSYLWDDNKVLYKIDKNGKKLWEFKNGGFFNGIEPLNTGDILLCGDAYLPDSDPDFEILRPTIDILDADGKVVWEKAERNIIGGAASIQKTHDGGLVTFIFNKGFSSKNPCASWMNRYMEDGTFMFSKSIGDTLLYGEGPEFSVAINDSTYIVANNYSTKADWTATKLSLIKVTASGRVLKRKIMDNYRMFRPTGISKTFDNKYLLSLTTLLPSGKGCYTIIKITDDLELDSFSTIQYKYDEPCFDTSIKSGLILPKPWIIKVDTVIPKGHFLRVNNQQQVKEMGKIYPNPTQDVINIEFLTPASNATYTIYDVAGKQVLTGVLTGTKTPTVNLQTLKQGIYILSIKQKNGEILRDRIIKE